MLLTRQLHLFCVLLISIMPMDIVAKPLKTTDAAVEQVERTKEEPRDDDVENENENGEESSLDLIDLDDDAVNWDQWLALEEPSETKVVSTRQNLSASARSVSGTEIAKSHSTSTDEVLGLTPGLRIVQHGAEGKGHQLFLRGFDAAHGSDVELLLEGVRLNEPGNVHGQGYIDLYGVIPEVIEKMDIKKGSFYPEQGNFAIAGTVHFNLGVLEEMRPGLLRLDVSHLGQLRGVAVAAPKKMNKKSFLALDTVYDAGFGPDREARRVSAIGSYFWEMGDTAGFSFLVSGQTARFESPGAVSLASVEQRLVPFHGAYGPAGEGLSDRVLSKVGYHIDTDDTDFNLFVYTLLRSFSIEENYTGYLYHPVRGDRKRQEQLVGTVGAAFDYSQKVKLSIPSSLLAGAGWRLDMGDQLEYQVMEDGEPWQTNRELVFSAHHFFGSLGFRVQPWRWLCLLPSVRTDFFAYNVEDKMTSIDGQKSLMNISPRLAMAIPFNVVWTVFGSYGRGFRSPEMRSVVKPDVTNVEDESVSQYGGGSSKISTSDSMELGVTYQPLSWLSLGLAGFSTWLKNEMVFDHVSNLNLEKNSTRRLGLELTTTLSPVSWFSLDGFLTLVDARFVNSKNRVPGTSNWLGTMRFFVGKPLGPQGALDLTWVSKRYLAHGAMVNAYAQIEMSAGWRFKHFETSFVLDNIGNSQNMDGVYHYASWFHKEQPQSSMPTIHYTAAPPITARIILTVFL